MEYFTEAVLNMPNIMQSDKFKLHMEVHKHDFIIPYEDIISYAVSYDYFSNLKEDLVQLIIEFPFNIGYSNLCKTTNTEEIIYAKRKNRDVYTRFTLDGQSKLINKCAVVLKRGKEDNSNVYYLITMFPGEYLVKEPQDSHIKTEEEKLKSIEFWNEHALVFNPKDVDLLTISYNCPYATTI